MDQKLIYHLPYSARVMMAVGFVFFSFVSFLAFRDDAAVAGYFFILFAVLCLISFVWSLYTVEITDHEIAVTNFLVTKQLMWQEIAKVEHKGDNLRLKNQDEDVILNIDSQVGRFPELVALIHQYIPQIWKTENITVFHPSKTAFASIAIMGGAGIMMIYAALRNGGENLASSLFIFVLGLFTIVMIFLMPFKISIEEEYLVTSHIGWKRRIHIQEIESVSLEQHSQESSQHFRVSVKLKNKKMLRFVYIREGTFTMAESLQNWLQKSGDTKEPE
jgi:hypothetical protein